MSDELNATITAYGRRARQPDVGPGDLDASRQAHGQQQHAGRRRLRRWLTGSAGEPARFFAIGPSVTVL
jgi:hypothetical protein